jgi:hypothetical protein
VEKTSPNIQVHLFTWIPENFKTKGITENSDFNKLLDYATEQEEPQYWRLMKGTLLLIDEAQLSYRYMKLWNDFIKYIGGSESGPLVVLFSSYGSPSDSPLAGEYKLPTPTPYEFNPNQRVSIRRLYGNNRDISLYFTRQEFNEVLARIRGQYANGQPFNPSDELIEYIWELCNGHPGGTTTVLKALIHSEVCFPGLLFVISANRFSL